MGAATDYQNSNNTTLNFGRYAISSWATQIDGKSGVVGAFVVDEKAISRITDRA